MTRAKTDLLQKPISRFLRVLRGSAAWRRARRSAPTQCRIVLASAQAGARVRADFPRSGLSREFTRRIYARSQIIRCAVSVLAAGAALAAMAAQAQQTQPARDVYSDTWVALDGLGRNLPGHDLSGAPKADRSVGMFYYVWHDTTSHRFAKSGEILDNMKIFRLHPDLAARPQKPELWEKYGYSIEGHPGHTWGEPLFGYYNSGDEWVIRKHAQMLCDAGVDTIIFDTSNVDARQGRDLSKHYIRNALTVCRVFSAIRAAGGRAPKFIFLTNGGDGRSASVIQWLYDNIYSKNLYRNAWFSWADPADNNRVKPVVLGYGWEASQPMRDYFTIRFSWAFNSGAQPKGAPGAGTRQ